MNARNSKEVTLKLMHLEDMEMAAECLRTLAHPARLRMVEMLLRQEYSVGELAEACLVKAHVASDHLGRMKDRGLLSSRRDGRHTYYSIAEDGLIGIMQCIKHRFGTK